MIRVFISGPYTLGDVEANVNRAIKVANELAVRGYVPFVPHLFHFWDGLYHHEYDFWTKLDLVWLRSCDCVVRLDGESPGADMETKQAKAWQIPVYNSLDELLASPVGWKRPGGA